MLLLYSIRISIMDHNAKFEIPSAQEPKKAAYAERQVMPRHAMSGHGLPKKKRHHVGRWVVGFLLLLLLSVVAYAGYVALSVANISTEPLELSGLATDTNGRTNILVLGVGDPGHAGQNLSDTIMVISVDGHTHRIAQISVPRDLRVDIPGYGAGKINQANADGGIDLAEQTVSNTLGIPINYYMITNFSGLKQMVDAVGGLDINVKDRLYDPEYPCADNENLSCGIDIHPGPQHMDGAKVLEYVRCRKGTCGNDFGRAARQQEVLGLLRQKITKLDVVLNPAKTKPVVEAFRMGVKTNMGAVQLAEFAHDWQLGQKNEPESFVLSTGDGGMLQDAYGSSDLLPVGGDFSAIQEKVRNIFDASPSPTTTSSN
jgi:LCP family protein required for cell wall assembly